MTPAGPLQVLGTIAAMETFVENFPMSILDLIHGPTYTSVFVFLIAVLRECNVTIQDIANRLISKIFGKEISIDGMVNTVYQEILDCEIDEQSEFLKYLETSVKSIIMALLTSIFSCSAIPLLPTKYFDTGRIHYVGTDEVDANFDYYRQYLHENFADDEVLVPKNILNSFGHLDVNPFSNAGKIYYSVDGGDKYYKKIEREESLSAETETTTVPNCDKLIKLYLEFGAGHADFLAGNGWYSNDEIQLRLTNPIDEDLKVDIRYKNANGDIHINTLTIRAGERVSEIMLITPLDGSIIEERILDIAIVGGDTGKKFVRNGETIYVYLSKPDSYDVVRFWDSWGNDSLSTLTWGDANNCGTKTVPVSSSTGARVFEYVQCDEPVQDAVRVKYVPTNPSEQSPEYIVSYSGLDPNTLCRTDDMNAFIWYVANRGIDNPQSEENKNMWDSRLTAKKYGIIRETGAEWNEWYNSKRDDDGELRLNDDYELRLFPIAQLKNAGDAISIKFPAQTYFKPNAVTTDNTTAYRHLRMNSTIYKFNYDYLQSIKIFNPRVLLFGMFDSLLDGALSLLLSLKISITRQELDKMLSSAIVKYIEADDMNIEDCYFTFSNEEYDKLLQQMLLSKYNATYTGGEVNRATQHDISDYLAKLDTVNFSSSATGEVTKITKLVTEVSATAGNEGTIEYGINAGIDDNWWKKLIWAIALPLIRCIFTPQVLMLFMINFQIMGITSLEDLWGNNQAVIIRLIINKIFGLIGSIIRFIKDKLAEILFDYYVEVILPTMEKYQLLKLREKLQSWITLLASAIACLPRLKFEKSKSGIDEVNYADIINEQITPESAGGC